MPQTSSSASSTSNHSDRSPYSRRLRCRPVLFLALAILAIGGGILVAWGIKSLQGSQSSDETVISTPGALSTPDTPTSSEPVPSFIDLQPTIDAWLSTVSADIGLVIYDLDNQQTAASYQPDKVFSVASIYKLFFVYHGYQQIEAGMSDPNAFFVSTSDYRTGSHTLGECLDLMIRESYNGCADPMHDDPTRTAAVEELISKLRLKSTTELGLYSSASDLAQLLELYWEHPDFSEGTWEAIADSMLNQPATAVAPGIIYDWRQGLPSGFNTAKVYDKVGWDWNGSSWNTYADAAIIEFPEQDRHYIAVVLSSGMTSPTATPFTKLGQAIEAAVLSES